MILYMYIAPGLGQKIPWGHTFDVNKSPYHFDLWLQVSNKSLNSDFIRIFNVFPHVCNPGAGADNPLSTKS